MQTRTYHSILHYALQKLLFFVFSLLLFFSCTKIKSGVNEHAVSSFTDDLTILHMDKPNIILIMSEDMGYEVPTANGGESYETPTLDKIAKEGMRFTQCHGSPQCAPSRWMMMTGKYNFRNYFYYGKMYSDQRTFANMLKDAGYETGVYGKWALNGGDTSVHNFGFNHYAIWNPYKDPLPGDKKGSIYKNPSIYETADYIADSLTKDKFGDDIFTDSVIHFMQVNKNKPFFVYYPMTLSHMPANPTPDDPAFATWDPYTYVDDTIYFPSQVKYADKKIGEIIRKVNKMNIASETVVIVVFGDNGTREGVTSVFNGSVIPGSRKEVSEYGTHVSLFVYWPGTVAPHSTNNDLVDFTDFLPTLAGIAKIPVPTAYGKIDGVSFYPGIMSQPGERRSWIYDYYWPVPNRPGIKTFAEWAQTSNYKLYDSSSLEMKGYFYKLENFTELEPQLDIATLSKKENKIRDSLLSVIQMMHEDPEYRFR